MRQKFRSIAQKTFSFSGFILMLLLSGQLQAQKSQAEYREHNRKVLNTKILLLNGNQTEGKYLTINDSIIWLIRPGVETDSVYKFHFTEIESITMHRKGSFLRGFAVGFGLTSAGSAALALSIENVGIFGPGAIYFLTEAIIGLPISAAFGLADAYRGKSIYTPIEGNPVNFEMLNKALEEEAKYATTRKTLIVKQIAITETEQLNQSNTKPENILKDSVIINKSNPSIAKSKKHKAFHFVESKKNIESPLMFNLRLIRGYKFHNGLKQISGYMQEKGFQQEPNMFINKNLWGFDLSVPLQNKMYVGVSREYKFFYFNRRFKQTDYTNNSTTNLDIRANSEQLIPYLALVNKQKNTLHPSGMQFSIRSGLIIEDGQLRLNSSSYQDGESYFEDYALGFSKNRLGKLGLQLQTTAEYYFFENFSIFTGAAAELKTPLKIRLNTIAPESINSIVFEEFKLNFSNIYIFAGIGIHF